MPVRRKRKSLKWSRRKKPSKFRDSRGRVWPSIFAWRRAQKYRCPICGKAFPKYYKADCDYEQLAANNFAAHTEACRVVL